MPTMDCESQLACPSPQRDQHTSAEALRQQLRERNRRGWRRIVLHFTPAWFSINMGTGIVSILLYNLPYNGPWLRYVAVSVFALNAALFSAFVAASATRYAAFPGIFLDMLRHPTQSLFLGTFPMGFATICNMFVYVCVRAWGSWAMNLAWAMWWLDAAVSVVICMFLPFAIMYMHDNGQSSKRLQDMTAVWLLPVVSTIVASATGGITAEMLVEEERGQHALWTLVTSYVLLGTGLPLAMTILVIYFQRLTLHRLPPLPMIVSVFLPLGPLGQGSFALMQLGQVGSTLLPSLESIPMDVANQAGVVLRVFGIVVALIMWGYGLVWLFFAIVSVTRSNPPFNMGKSKELILPVVDSVLMIHYRLVGVHLPVRRVRCLHHDARDAIGKLRLHGPGDYLLAGRRASVARSCSEDCYRQLEGHPPVCSMCPSI